MVGPIDYVAIGFNGNAFDGSIMHELNEAVNKDIIRVIDLVFIMKDRQGNLIEGEYDDQSPEFKAALGELWHDEGEPILSDSDIAKIGEHMETDTSAAILVIEQLWARKLKQALLDANGFLIAEGRIHPELFEAAEQELQQVQS